MSDIAENLCLACGMCCDGTVFADVKLSAEDRLRLSQAKPLPVSVSIPKGSLTSKSLCARLKGDKLKQPCPAWIEGKCGIYRYRPDHCRNFDCALLQKVQSGIVPAEPALKTVQSCRRRADKVRRLLRELGDDAEHLALMTRFRRTLRHYEQVPCDAKTLDRLAQLTLTAHALNRALAKHIYP